MMKAVRLVGSGPGLIATETSRPSPGRGEVLVRVFAAGVTPTELQWYPTSHTKTGERRRSAILSHEFAGEVAEVGDDFSGLRIGEKVYGMNDWFDEGALAEYCVTRAGWIAPMPEHLSAVEAASIPISALTAWQGLFDRAGLHAGERVLIHGGAGAVGMFAVQLAHFRKAHVITTVSSHNAEFVQKLGADETIDYKATPFEDAVRDVDVVLDTVGGETLRRSWSVLKPRGRLVTVAADSEGVRDQRTTEAFFIVEPDRRQLLEIGRMLSAGTLRCFVGSVVPFSRAQEAYAPTAKKSGRGKVVVEIVQSGQTRQA